MFAGCIPTQARLVRTIPPTTLERRQHHRSSVASIFTWLSTNTPARVLKHGHAPLYLPDHLPSPTLRPPPMRTIPFRLHSRPWLHRPLRPIRALRRNRLLRALRLAPISRSIEIIPSLIELVLVQWSWPGESEWQGYNSPSSMQLSSLDCVGLLI